MMAFRFSFLYILKRSETLNSGKGQNLGSETLVSVKASNVLASLVFPLAEEGCRVERENRKRGWREMEVEKNGSHTQGSYKLLGGLLTDPQPQSRMKAHFSFKAASTQSDPISLGKRESHHQKLYPLC